MDKFAAIRAFTIVVEERGFSAAARAMGVSRSQANKQVIALEEALGVQLFNRSTRHIAPTSEGLVFYERARRILEDLDEAEAALSATAREVVGRLRISAPLSLGRLNFSAIIVGFMKRHPALEVELVQDARLVDPIAEGFDCVIRIAQPDEETPLVDHRIAPVEYVTCAARSYLDRAGIPGHPLDLTDHSLLHYPGSENTQVWRYTGADGPVIVPVKPTLTANSLEPLREAACAGLGVAMLPRYAIEHEVQRGEMVCVLREYGLPSFMLQLVYPPSRGLSAKVQLLTEFLSAHFADGVGARAE
ncbi:MAG: LysR substrate-binding domain-containing protein [Pseudomonadota bacterium]